MLGTEDMKLGVLCQVKSTENAAKRVIRTLRELPSKEALALRSEVASQVGMLQNDAL